MTDRVDSLGRDKYGFTAMQHKMIARECILRAAQRAAHCGGMPVEWIYETAYNEYHRYLRPDPTHKI